MSAFIDGDTAFGLTGLAVVLVFGAAILILRIRMRRRMRKREWSASHDPITNDFAGQAGLTNQRQTKTSVDIPRATQVENVTSL